MIEEINHEQVRIESAELSMQPLVDEKAMRLYGASPEAARAYLTEYCVRNADAVLDSWRGLLDRLVDVYDDGGAGPVP